MPPASRSSTTTRVIVLTPMEVVALVDRNLPTDSIDQMVSIG
jgi:hypothetical protein